MNWTTTSITSFGPATLENQKRPTPSLATRNINSVSDIAGASSNFKYNKFQNKPDLFDTSDVSGSKPKSLRTARNVMDTSLYVDDIDGARTFIKDKMLRTGRHVNPLQPTYDLPSYSIYPSEQKKFVRDTLDVSDVDGAAPRVPRKFEPRETMPNDIDGAQACWRPRHAKARLEAPPSDIMNVSDIIATKKPLEVTKRRTNPISPNYTIYGSDIHDDPRHTKPRPLPKQVFGGHLLETHDINTSTKAWQPHMRREFRNLTTTMDIEGAQADTVIHSIVTKRATNPLQPTYQGLDRDLMLEPPVMPLMPPSIITRPTMRPSKDNAAPPAATSSSSGHPETSVLQSSAPASARASARRDDLEPAPFTSEFVAPVQGPPGGVPSLDLMATDPSARGAPAAAMAPLSGNASGGRKSSRAYDAYDPKPTPVSTGRSGGRLSQRGSARPSARDKAAMSARDADIQMVRDL